MFFFTKKQSLSNRNQPTDRNGYWLFFVHHSVHQLFLSVEFPVTSSENHWTRQPKVLLMSALKCSTTDYDIILPLQFSSKSCVPTILFKAIEVHDCLKNDNWQCKICLNSYSTILNKLLSRAHPLLVVMLLVLLCSCCCWRHLGHGGAVITMTVVTISTLSHCAASKLGLASPAPPNKMGLLGALSLSLPVATHNHSISFIQFV